MTLVIAAMTIVTIFALRIWGDRNYTPAQLKSLTREEKNMKVL